MKTFTLVDGWYWSAEDEYRGPFASEDEAINDYIDGHVAPEE